MYRETIKFKKEIDDNLLNKIKEIGLKYYNNRAGKLNNVSDDKYTMIFQGEDETAYQVMSLGSLTLYKENKEFVNCVDKWTFEDTDDPDDNCDVLETYK